MVKPLSNLDEKSGLILFLQRKIGKIQTSKTMSLVNDCQGVKCNASPKQPQSVTLLK